MRGKPEVEPDETPLGVTDQIIGWLAHEVGHISKLSGCVSFIVHLMLSLMVLIVLMPHLICSSYLAGAAAFTLSAFRVTTALRPSRSGRFSSASWPPS